MLSFLFVAVPQLHLNEKVLGCKKLQKTMTMVSQLENE